MNNFKINVLIKILLITVCIFILFYFYFNNYALVLIVVFGLLIVWQLIILLKFVDKTNDELFAFLQSVKYSDYSINFNFGKYGKSFKNISDEFNAILSKIKDSRSEKEESNLYLQTIIEHIGVGLISFDSYGKIDLINRNAKRILKINTAKDLGTLNNINENFGDFMFRLIPGQQITYSVNLKDETILILLFATEFKMRGQTYKIVTLQNIQPEIEKKEIEAYQKLIRVLTHEIMNSVTPISSLASTAEFLLKDKLNNSCIDNDLTLAIETIKKRSEGLVKFVEKYRDLAKVPKPNFEIFSVSTLFERIKFLMDSALKDTNIQFFTEISPVNLEINADQDLIEQVLINLLNNAVYAINQKQDPFLFKDNYVGEVILKAFIDERGKAVIKISDNGVGIEDEILDKIFIPFFTTKKEGSGIGLSISKQIINAHYGSLSVKSSFGKTTTFTIRF
ncbi:MAG TPA: ATP-binding protein [Melioribacteraceae bacterium]|nr:ATP-binding protein [Melioribacteraceae bacterium]